MPVKRKLTHVYPNAIREAGKHLAALAKWQPLDCSLGLLLVQKCLKPKA